MTESPWIPYARQSISDEDIRAVTAVLRSSHLTQGPAVEAFEQAVASYVGAKYAVAVNSATSALHVACLAAGLGKGDRHWTSPNTFVASSNCGLYCGSTADFVDIDPRTYNMGFEAFEKKIAEAKSTATLPKVVIPVAFAGQSADMRRIHELAKANGISVIEDASHAIGASYCGKKVGHGTYADMTVFSFHPVKIITTGEGGVVVTNDENLYNRLVRFRSHGITRDPRFLEETPDGPWTYEQIDLGFNYRLTDIQAVLGKSQLGRIDAFVERRRYLASRYEVLLAGLPLLLPTKAEDAESAWHLYVVRLDPERVSISRRELFLALQSRGIGTNVHYIPVHLQPYYRRLGFKKGMFPEAENYYREALSLPMYFDFSNTEQERVAQSLRDILIV